MTPVQIAVDINHASAVAEARQRGAVLARALALDETAAGALAIAITETATNIVKHGVRGTILFRGLAGERVRGVEALAFDHGPGMRSVADSMRDGHSTGGTPGTGLGALRRMTSNLDIWSQPGTGTLLRFEVWPKGTPVTPAMSFVTGAVCLPKPGESECGDAWSVAQRGADLVVLLVDGLGHGPSAADAARAAVVAASGTSSLDPAQVIDTVHGALRPTRGAAGAAIVLQPDRGRCMFCGIGNIAASVQRNGTARSMVSHAGILGHQVRKIQGFEYPLAPGALLVAHSDGIATRWDLSAYPGLESRHPSLVAAALYRDHSRGRDDVTVVGVRVEQRPT